MHGHVFASSPPNTADHLSGLLPLPPTESPLCSCEGEDREVVITLEDVLTFVTGASCIPPMGFDRPPQIIFGHDNAHYPTESTCVPSLTIPSSMKEISVFISRMAEAIVRAVGFGRV